MGNVKDLTDVGRELEGLGYVIRKLLRTTGFSKHGELDLSVNSADDHFWKEQYTSLLDQLDSFGDNIEYLTKPIYAEGFLHLNPRGRYEFRDNELTSGSTIEFLYYDDFDGVEKWNLARIEHSGDYYIYGYKSVPLEGLRVRIRR